MDENSGGIGNRAPCRCAPLNVKVRFGHDAQSGVGASSHDNKVDK